MPKVLSLTPSWLCRPAPGSEVFAPAPSKVTPGTRVTDIARRGSHEHATRRTIAYRGSEIFVVVGNELRWSDLVMLSEKGERAKEFSRSARSSRNHSRVPTEVSTGSYRILRVPFAGQITRLAVSPAGEYMAIATSHAIHIAVLPDSTHLGSNDTGPLKLKTFQLGPTAHVLEQSPLASVLWHPMGVDGRALVTVTEDATVRLWEINKDNRSSFESPALSVDLKKLANATNAEEDLRASTFGAGKGFSPDAAELEVAAACFGRASGPEDGCVWPAMTLWISTTDGDLYALCPLLPSRWQLKSSEFPQAALAGLAASIRARSELVLTDDSTSEAEKRAAYQQREWLAELLEMTPSQTTVWGTDFDIYSRPRSTPPVPRLQGPFQLTPEVYDDATVVDIFVTALQPKGNGDDLDGFDEFDGDEEDELASIICLSTDDGHVRICLDPEGVEAKWLPSTKGLSSMFERALRLGSSRSTPIQQNGYLVGEDDSSRPLLVLETISLQSDNKPALGPLFTADTQRKPGVFVTHGGGISYLSLNSWATQLSEELAAAQEEGSEFRLDLILQEAKTRVQPITRWHEPQTAGPSSPSACIVLEDSDLGYFLLSAADGQAYAAILDIPQGDAHSDTKLLASGNLDQIVLNEPRQPYQPPAVFWQESALVTYYKNEVPLRQKQAFAKEISLSPAALEILTKAHRILSQETHQLGVAAADLFRRCERLQNEFRDQLQKASELASRVDRITGDDEEEFGEDEEDNVVGNERIERRLDRVRNRQDELTARYEALKMKLAKVGGGELSKNEKAWAEETKQLDKVISQTGEEEDSVEEGETTVGQRVKQVKRLKDELIAQAKEVERDGVGAAKTDTVRVPSEMKRQQVAKVMELLERETALVNAAHHRLSKLKMSAALP